MKFIFLSLIFSFSLFAQNFNLDDFINEVSSRQSRVEEFRFIKETAKKLGIKNVYMFGGTAAAWAHYVRWDMRRELDIDQLQAERFDYDYTNIFRANQDFDLVVDATVEQASELEKLIQAKFNYFSGTRASWEVRLLNEKRKDKDSLFSFDFQSQHTDSHSTGLINMMDCEDHCILDIRDFENPQNSFLMDVFEAKLRFYFSKEHSKTSRFKKGLNPPIISVVRYFTKAVQYQLEMREEDIKKLEEIIFKFKPRSKYKSGYVYRWLQKNAKKLIVNAINMEYAQKLIEETGLKKKLLELSNANEKDSVSWWLNKEALKSYPLGRGTGKTAAELFGNNRNTPIIVAHETNSFEAFESITKSHTGKANVLISRKGVSGEAAAYGDGHYVRLGRQGARGTGLTIRYRLNPNARHKTDFTYNSDYLIIKNKAALEVIYENMNLSPSEYFEKILGGLSFDKSDKGVLEKLKRRTVRKIGVLTTTEEKKLLKVLNKAISQRNDKGRLVLQEWFSIKTSANYPEVLNTLYDSYKYDELIEYFKNNSASNSKGFNFIGFLMENVLSTKHWAKKNPERVLDLIRNITPKYYPLKFNEVFGLDIWFLSFKDVVINELLLKETNVTIDSLVYLFSNPKWKKYFKNNHEVVKKLISHAPSDVVEAMVKGLFSDKYWQAHSDILVNLYNDDRLMFGVRSSLHYEVFLKDVFWYKSYPQLFNKVMLNFMISTEFEKYAKHEFIDWKKHQFDYSLLLQEDRTFLRTQFINYFIKGLEIDVPKRFLKRFYNVLNLDNQKLFVKGYMGNSREGRQEIVDYVVKSRNPELINIIITELIEKDGYVDDGLVDTLLESNYDQTIKDKLLANYFKKEGTFLRHKKQIMNLLSQDHLPYFHSIMVHVAKNILSQRDSINHPELVEKVLNLSSSTPLIDSLIENAFSKIFWIKHPKMDEWVDLIVNNYPDSHSTLIDHVFKKSGRKYARYIETFLQSNSYHHSVKHNTLISIAELFQDMRWEPEIDLYFSVLDYVRKQKRNDPYLYERIRDIGKAVFPKEMRKYRRELLKKRLIKVSKQFCSQIYL